MSLCNHCKSKAESHPLEGCCDRCGNALNAKSDCLSRQQVREVLEKHARRPRAECQSIHHQDANRKAEAKIKQIIEELGL